LPWTTLSFAVNKIDIYHEQHWHLPWTALTFGVNNIYFCHEHADVYNTWCEKFNS
jgi:hypothetical protein